MSKEELQKRKEEYVNKYNMIINRIQILQNDITSMRNEALMLKGAIDFMDKQLSEDVEQDNKIANINLNKDNEIKTK